MVFNITVPDAYIPALNEYVRNTKETKHDPAANVTITKPMFESVEAWIAAQVAGHVRAVIEHDPPAHIAEKRKRIEDLHREIESDLEITAAKS